MKRPFTFFFPLLTFLALPLHATGIPITGRVLAPDGKPAAGAHVLLVPEVSVFEFDRLEPAGKAGPAPVATAATDAAGSFQLTAPDAGMWRVRVEGAGYVPLETLLLPLTEETELPDAQLVPNAGLQVKVADPRGKPLANAWVRVESPPTASPAGGPWRIPTRRVAFTDASGGVTVPRTRDEVLTVWAAAPGYLPARQEKVHGGAASLRLAAGAARRIEVHDAQGKPMAGVPVALVGSSWVAGRTAEGGRLDLPVPPAGLDLRLLAEDGRRLTYRLRAARPEEKGPAVIVLAPTAPATGRVVADGTGHPLPGALVWPDRDPGAMTRAGKGGTFRLAHLAEESRVFATTPGYFTDAGRAAHGRLPTFSLQPRLSAAGIVVDEAGRPVAGASLRAAPSSIPRRNQSQASWSSGGFVHSAASGRFRLAALAAGVTYELRAEREGFAPSRQELPARRPGAPGPEIRVVLHPGRTAFGRVIEGGRRPVAGARVSLQPTPAPDLWNRIRQARNPLRFPTATTDASGRFEVRSLPPGSFDLEVRAHGFAPLTVPALAIPAGQGVTDLGTVQLAPGGTVHGVVVDPQGEPVADAEVQAKGADRDGALFRLFPASDAGPEGTVTAADGTFTLEDLSPGVALDLTVTHPGYGPGAAPGVAVPSEDTVRVVLQPASRVSGHVTGPDGKPVAGAEVALREESARVLGDPFVRLPPRSPHQEVTDDEGAFSFADVAPGAFQIAAAAPGHQRALLKGLEAKPGQDLSGIAILLSPGATVEGTVRSTDGKPVEDAEVSVADGSSGDSSQTSTDADGYYRIEELPPGPHTLEARANGYRRAVRDVEATVETRGVDFQLDRGLEVSGRVVDETGSPVPDAGVDLSGRPGPPQSAVSDGDGSFRLSGVEDGTYRLTAGKKEYGTAEKDLTVADAPVSEIELRLSPAREGAIVGQLTGLEFSQLAHARVWADSGNGFGAVDAEGSYRIDHLAPGDHKVLATVPDTPLHAEGKVTLADGATEARLDLHFGGGHTLTGVVLRNGEPCPGASLVLSNSEHVLRAATDLQGELRFEGVEDGGYELRAGTASGVWHREDLTVSGDQTIRVEMHTASLSGRVVDATDSSPVSGARISLQGAEAFGFSLVNATSDARGVFQLAEVGEGSWTVQATREGYAAGERKVEVGDGPPPGDLEIRLDPTQGVTVEPLLPTGRPPVQVRVAALDGAGQVVATGTFLTGENGGARISNVPPGSWLLLVDSDQSAAATVPATVPGPAVPVILPPAGQLQVQVPALADDPNVRLVLSGAGGLYRTLDSNGTVTSEWGLDGGSRFFDRVPAGVWQVTARAADGRSWSGTATVTPGGSAVVELR